MIIDLITNNEDIVNFVKKKEAFGGRIEEKDGKYKMFNVQIGYIDRFSTDLDNFSGDGKIDMNKYGYEIYDSRGKLVAKSGKLS